MQNEINDLLALPFFIEDQRKRFYKLCAQAGVTMYEERLACLLKQSLLFDDDVQELEELCARLEITVRRGEDAAGAKPGDIVLVGRSAEWVFDQMWEVDN